MRFAELIDAIRRQPIEAEILANEGTKKIVIPSYNFKRLPPNYCSRFVRFAGKDVFNVDYPIGHAWDLRHKGCRTIPLNGKSLVELYNDGLVVPGDSLGIENPESPYGKYLDITGNKRKYTHVGLFIGISPEEEDLIVDEFGFMVRLTSEKELRESGKYIAEVIKPLGA